MANKSSRFPSTFLLLLLQLALVTPLPLVNAVTFVEGHITQDTTWTLANSPYRVINEIIVNSAVTLTIEPGVRVEFADNFSLVVNGSLYAIGSANRQIGFSSSRLNPSPGVWGTIKFIGGASSSLSLEYALVEYATNGVTIDSDQGMVSIRKSMIVSSSESGLQVVGLVPMIVSDNTISWNRRGVFIGPTGQNPYLNINFYNNTGSNNLDNGIYVSAWSVYGAAFFSNNVSSNGANGLYVYANVRCCDASHVRNMEVSSNTFTGNGGDGILIWTNSYYGYIVDATFSSNTISHNGQRGLHLRGCNWDRGTCYSPSAVGYVYNVNISSNEISSNNSDGILIESPYAYNITVSTNRILSNRASGVLAESAYHSATVKYDFIFSENAVSSNGDKGIWIYRGGRANITLNSISYNRYGVFFSGSYYYTTTDNTANYNDIYRNVFGMNITITGCNTGQCITSVNAEHDFWGDPTGPFHSSINPEGRGNPVNGNGVDLDFVPFLSAPIGHINDRPTARLTVDRTSIAIGQQVTFDASSSTDDGRVDEYLLSFGDALTSGWTTLSVLKHNYTSLGAFVATLLVRDDFGVESVNPSNVSISVGRLPSLTVSLFLNATAVGPGESVSIRAHVTDGTLPVGGASVQRTSDNSGTFSPQTGLTASSGDFASIFLPPSVTSRVNVRITATATKTGFSQGSNSEYLTVNPTPLVHDIAVTAVSTSTSSVAQGQTLSVTVSVRNEGDATETFTVTAYYNVSPIGSLTVTGLEPSLSRTVSITWNTAGVVPGSYAIKASASPVPGETDTTDNSKTDGTVSITGLSVSVVASPAEVDSDERVSILIAVTYTGRPLPSTDAVLSSNSSGTFSSTTGRTDGGGYLTRYFTTPTVAKKTIVRITVSVTRSGYPPGQGEVLVTVNPPRLIVSVTANPSTLRPNQTSSISVRVTYGGVTVRNATVTLSSNVGRLTKTTGSTDGDGLFLSEITAPADAFQGSIVIIANATKPGYPSGQNQFSIPLENPAHASFQPWTYATGGVIALLVLGGLVAIARRRRK